MKIFSICMDDNLVPRWMTAKRCSDGAVLPPVFHRRIYPDEILARRQVRQGNVGKTAQRISLSHMRQSYVCV